jgi:glycerophosphoryl diester phosphodiesterase
MRKREFLCFGHRGAMGHTPENTLLSVKKALDLGVKWIEIDVYHIEDELIVIHDDRLERTTDGKGYVQEQSLKYIRSLDAGEGEKIPLLREVLDLITGRAGINIELKGENTAKPVVDLIRKYVKKSTWTTEDFLISSFNHHELLKAKQLFPELKIGALMCAVPIEYSEFGEKLNAYSVNISLEFVCKAFVDDAHNRGLKVFVYTVNHTEDILKMYNVGVDGVFTNYPDRVFSLLL